MDRRSLLGVVGTAGVVATAGCSAPGRAQTISDPAVNGESDQRKFLSFTADGDEVATFGVDGRVADDVIELPIEIWHREGTTVDAITLQVWTPPRDATASVAVVSPVSGDSSPPPEITLSVPSRGQGQLIEITDLDDLADETISTLELLVRPDDEWAGKLSIDAVIELGNDELLGSDYTLDGRLDLSFPEMEPR